MSPHQHIGNPTGPPYPAHSIHHASSSYDLSSSAYIHGVRRSNRFSNTWMASKTGGSERPMIRHIASPNEQSILLGKKWQRITIKMLSEDTLLEIFDFYRLGTMKQFREHPWEWHRLAHVCRKWRHVISMSPRRLDLHILCEYGAPVEGILRSWPTLPLVVRFNARLSKHMPGNVAVALCYPNRLRAIYLEVTSSMTGLIVEAIQKPCEALESIQITVRDAHGPSILVRNAFLGGSAPRLREIKLDGIAFPFSAIQQVLLSTNNLVELHLSKIPDDVYFSPEDLVTGLSTSVQLERLTVGFHSPASRPPPSMTRPPPHRTTLPTLRSLYFYGATEYLEELLVRMDSHALCKIFITLFNDIVSEIPQFCDFMSRQNMLRSPTLATVTFSSEFVTVSFFLEANPGNVLYYSLRSSCIPLDWKLSFLTEITSQLSPLLSSVHELTIATDSRHEVLTGEKDVDSESTQWLELFQAFTQVTKVTVWENQEKQLLPGIMQALVMGDMATGVLPELTTLHLYGSTPSVAKAAELFVTTRNLSDRTIYLYC